MNGRGAPGRRASPMIIFCPGLHVIAHRAALDVQRELA
jgi:hypothetical protein